MDREVTAARRPLSAGLWLALLIQAGGIVWWASAQDRAVFFMDQRVSAVEVGLERAGAGQGQMLERLARIEERVNSQLSVLDRIEKQIQGGGRL